MADINNIILWIIFLALIPAIIWFFRKLKAAQDEIKDVIAQRFAGKTIYLQDPLALHIAQQSSGYSQSRGNGNLILTGEELFFAMPFPKKIISIPLASIGEIERPMRMNGQCIMKRLLKVNFKTEDGKEDAIGFHVKALDQWESEIRLRCGGFDG